MSKLQAAVDDLLSEGTIVVPSSPAFVRQLDARLWLLNIRFERTSGFDGATITYTLKEP